MIHDLKNKMSISHLQNVIEGLGYKWFSNGDFNVNIIGVRNPNLISNSFDDTMLMAFKIKGHWNLKEWAITTDAGKFYLEHPMNEKGCALLVPNQYRSCYAIDKHRGKYEALCQRLGKVEVYRDDNKDQILDFDNATKEWGMFGVNVHRAGTVEIEFINRNSAACQVFKKSQDFDDFLKICFKAAVEWGNSFTYTLINEEDLKLNN